jgi:hypothetical protein
VFVKESNPLAGAFTRPGYLVKLTFARQSFVVAIPWDYATDEQGALMAAVIRAKEAKKLGERGMLRKIIVDEKLHLGDVISHQILKDTPASRKMLQVDGEAYTQWLSTTMMVGPRTQARPKGWYNLGTVRQENSPR